MSRTWAEVSSTGAYKSLPLAEQEAARQQYFNEVVAPQVPEYDLQIARTQFDKETQPKYDPDTSNLRYQLGRAAKGAGGLLSLPLYLSQPSMVDEASRKISGALGYDPSLKAPSRGA